MDVLRSVQPYLGGRDDLLLLRKLDIADKHHSLIPAYSAVTGLFGITKTGGDKRPVRFSAICPVEDGTVLYSAGGTVIGSPLDEVYMEYEARFEIAFGYHRIAEGKPIIPTLKQLLEVADGVVGQFRPLLP